MYCNTVHDWKQYKAKYSGKFLESLHSDSSDTLYIDTRWVVLYSSEEQKIPLSRIQDCLRMLNIVYAKQNTVDLQKVPTSWSSVTGNPNIQFLPLDPTKLTVEYIPISGNLDGDSPVSDAASRGGRTNGVLNIYIGSSGKGSILGQAELNSNIVYALYSAVGGFDVKGTLPGYDLGKTVVHEVGHALGLVHTFSDNACDHFSPYDDVPEQIRPNYSTSLVQLSNGSWEQRGDNRYNDRLNGSSLSCLSIQPDPDTAPNEMGINFMDYGDDNVSLVFSKNQVDIMRQYLQSSDNTTLTLKSAADTSISAGGTASSSGGSLTSSSSDSSSSSGLSTTWIILIVVFSVLILIVIAYFVYRHHSKRSSDVIRRSEAYLGAHGWQTR
jgi:preprotein translocase subunit SecG